MKTFLGIAAVVCLIAGMFILLSGVTNEDTARWTYGYIMVGVPLAALLIAAALKKKQEE